MWLPGLGKGINWSGLLMDWGALGVLKVPELDRWCLRTVMHWNVTEL